MKRQDWVDIAKGIGIILVILGHMSVARILIYSFHMPLFFFISGYLYKQRDFRALMKYICVGLIIPYFIWGCALAGAMYIATRMGFGNGRSEFADIKLQVMNLFYGADMKHVTNAAPALWFLVALAEVIVLYWCIKQAIKETTLQGIFMIVLAIMDCFLLRCEIILPYNLNVVLLVAPFYFCGDLYKNMDKVVHMSGGGYKAGICLMLCVILCVGSWINGNVNVVIGVIGKSEVFYYINAFSGIVIVIICSVYIEKIKLLKRILCQIGRRTLGIMCVHASLIYVLSSVFDSNGFLSKCFIFGITLSMSYGIAIIYDKLYSAVRL